MKTNEIAPFMGNLVWVGEPKSGVSQSGKPWTSLDFTIRYNDGKKDRHITFNAFGEERVNLVMGTAYESRLRVTWFPDSHESNGRWWTKLSAVDIKVVEEVVPADRQNDDDLPI